jgi:hypothetical protein
VPVLLVGTWLGMKVAFRLIDDPCLEGGTISLRTPLALLLISLGAIAAVWWWLAIPTNLARAPIDPNAKPQCISYAPFRDHETSLRVSLKTNTVATTAHIPPKKSEDSSTNRDRVCVIIK